MNVNQETKWVVARLLVVILRDMPKAHTHPEVIRTVVWLEKAFDGIDKLGRQMALLQREQRDLRRMYEMGIAANDLRDVIAFVLSGEKGLDCTAFRRVTERLVAAMTNHFRDITIAQFKGLGNMVPEDPLPDACLVISSEE